MHLRTFLCIAIISTASLHGETYYIAPQGHDAGNGTQESPWQTIGKAAESLRPGDTVLIRSGTYRERLVPGRSGRPGSSIEYKAYPGDRVTIDGQGFALP